MADDFMTSTKPARLPWFLFAAAVIVAGLSGYFAWAAHQQSKTTKTALEDTTKRLETAEADNAALEAKLVELSAKSEELQQNLASTEAELAKLKEDAGALEDKLKTEIEKGEIQVKQLGQKIQVDLVDRIIFDSGEAVLSTRGQEVLGRVAAVLQTIEDKQIQVSGHTDNVPIKNEELKKQFPTNWELSSARAVNVVRYLSETGGVKRERLTAAGYGEYHPIASNATPKGRAKNRRIEILLTPSLDAKKTALAPKAAPTAAAAKATPKK